MENQTRDQQTDLRTVWWDGGKVALIDQRQLPHRQVTVYCHTLDDVAQAIRTMQVRGAPAIGCSAAYGMTLAVQQQVQANGHQIEPAEVLDILRKAKAVLDAQRPTAVNLAWATERMLHCAHNFWNNGAIQSNGNDPMANLASCLLQEAHAILSQDLSMCYAMGQHGAPLIPERGHVLTHCNAGGLATAGYGTALAPLRTATEQGRKLHVYVDETRPYLQGARLTSWELHQADIDQTLVTDNMAGYLMRNHEVDCVMVGADRIVANGDIANKIGTYTLAVLAQMHGVPFYVVAPSSTIDMACHNGDDIPIEERSPDEVTCINQTRVAPDGINAAHPAFDVTPHELITAIITERGVLYPPFDVTLRNQFKSVAQEA